MADITSADIPPMDPADAHDAAPLPDLRQLPQGAGRPAENAGGVEIKESWKPL
jgi:hypothetical protein